MISWQKTDLATRWAIVVIGIGVLLRLVLALVNLESNDDHLSVSRVIANEGRVPMRTEMVMAYHPKLWHASVAMVWQLLPATLSGEGQIKTAQLLNALAGSGVVIIAYAFIFKRRWQIPVKLIALSLVSFNPRLIGISAQATNDSWAIFFGTAAVWLTIMFFETGRQKYFYQGMVMTVLMALTKGGGLVLFAVLISTLLVEALWWGKKRLVSQPRAVFLILLVILIFCFIVIPLTPYWSDWMAEGEFFGPRYQVEPRPFWFKQTYGDRPGVTSIYDSFFTFRIEGLLQEPMITLGNEEYPLHRTSYWSQLYGRFNFVHFERWPSSWELDTPFIRMVGRASMVLGLWPLGLFMFGIWRTGHDMIKKITRGEGLSSSTFFILLGVIAFLAAGVSYSINYRPFYAMKVIYILPVILANVYLFGEAADIFYRRIREVTRWQEVSNTVFVLLFIVHITDITILCLQLSK
ncbi:MAG TPA: hypothetical protein DDW41_04490 [Candidatus Andersenbacteria bacterium]|nr:MAG: Glycosyl transferase family 39 [Parcubacteria group bacterium GW2011_GWA2_45_14]OGY35093.1 MAG: hypothetical protein A3B76_04585 [Candidatus Andersenbacteria bacterium RIFCSPHIGHO2_02_FULL_46_16]HBE90438.1 hypothetical protein [Candidatus Andersenbacteria bacterium]